MRLLPCLLFPAVLAAASIPELASQVAPEIGADALLRVIEKGRVKGIPEQKKTIERAAERGRKGEGPTLLDIKTYRYKGHSMSDPQKYRTKDEVSEYQNQDPIEHVLRVIRENKWMSEAEIEGVEDEIKQVVEASVKFAEESPLPTADELYKDVYMQDDYPYVND